MSEIHSLNPAGATGSLAPSQNRVLRNTYMLLALSLVPTVIGATLGMQMKFSLLAGSPFIGFMLFLAIAFGFFYAIEKTKNSVWGVVILLGFTFFMGLMLSRLLGVVLNMSNGGTLVATAFGGTSIIFFAMASLAGTIKRDLSNMGQVPDGGRTALDPGCGGKYLPADPGIDADHHGAGHRHLLGVALV